VIEAVGVAVSTGSAARLSELRAVDPMANTIRPAPKMKSNFNHSGVWVRPPRRVVDLRSGGGPDFGPVEGPDCGPVLIKAADKAS
jgi:hypothetical protein